MVNFELDLFQTFTSKREKSIKESVLRRIQDNSQGHQLERAVPTNYLAKFTEFYYVDPPLVYNLVTPVWVAFPCRREILDSANWLGFIHPKDIRHK